MLRLQISDRGAAYPVRIDPLIERHGILPRDLGRGGSAEFGSSVSLSANGTIALVSGPYDENGAHIGGAVWVYTRTGSTWTEQQKIIPHDETPGPSAFGFSVALSSNGSTAIIGGPEDGNGCAMTSGSEYLDGAVWVYTRSGRRWIERQKIVATDEVSPFGGFGESVAVLQAVTP